MPRSSRIVIPDVPHHVVQRGNRRQPIFFSEEDRSSYIDWLAEGCRRFATRCLAWCLMDNHVHLILVPSTTDGLRGPVASAATRLSQRVNRMQQTSGHLFQGRYASYAMDDAHLMVALRYVENNPVKAGLVDAAEQWTWSSAAAHVARRPDRLVSGTEFAAAIPNWRAMLAKGLEAAEDDAEAVEAALLSGRPRAAPAWLAGHAGDIGGRMALRRRGRPPKIGEK
ncbi:MAG: transposase [Sphingopyxis sp.]|nr:transposase [Sphingopyxis sp.]